MSTITTYKGLYIDPLQPDESLIDIQDIAHALSLLCRGNGHVRFFYSVAQHSLACAKEAKQRGYDQRIQLGCLLHDASEAYLADVPRPLKRQWDVYNDVEKQLQMIIFDKYIQPTLTKDEIEKICKIDDDMLAYEFHQLMPHDISLDYHHIQSSVCITYQNMKKIEDEFVFYFMQCFDNQYHCSNNSLSKS